MCSYLFLALIFSLTFAQIPLRTGITSPLLECPPPSTQGGKLNAWQEACDMQFKICSSSPEMIPRAGSKYTLTSTKTSMCELCWADLYTCYSDCRIPGPPVTFNKMCNDACAPLFAYHEKASWHHRLAESCASDIQHEKASRHHRLAESYASDIKP